MSQPDARAILQSSLRVIDAFEQLHPSLSPVLTRAVCEGTLTELSEALESVKNLTPLYRNVLFHAVGMVTALTFYNPIPELLLTETNHISRN